MKKSALLISDLSVYSKSSLLVSHPIVESMDIESASLPTVLLSTQTDGLPTPIEGNIASFFESTLSYYKRENIDFDGVYIGYIKYSEEFDAIEEYLKDYRGYVLLDPILGDNNELYPGITKEHVSSMRRLARYATTLTPNIYEASWLLDEDLSLLNDDEIEKRISSLGSSECYLKGLRKDENTLRNLYIKGSVISKEYHDLKRHYPGLGDIFSSLVFSLTLKGIDPRNTLERATLLSSETLRRSIISGRDVSLGIDIYPVLEMIGNGHSKDE